MYSGFIQFIFLLGFWMPTDNKAVSPFLLMGHLAVQPIVQARHKLEDKRRTIKNVKLFEESL